MKSSIFRFQQFAIRQQDSEMKVGTDAVLLGAWVLLNGSVKRVLDVGTGTGILALMLAQRFPKITIDAIDVNENAAAEAAYNFEESPWSYRLSCQAESFLDFLKQTNVFYDHIVCNPPYYLGNDHISEEGRNQARNTSYLPLEVLFKGFQKLLSSKGKCSLVLPSDRLTETLTLAEKNNLYLIRKTLIRGNKSAPFKRVLLSFSKEKSDCSSSNLTLEVTRHQRTKEHQNLVNAFYLPRN